MTASASTGSRGHDVVVWGATGFTGRLVAEYLAQRYPAGNGLRWAIAGRDRGRLEQLRHELGLAADTLPVLLADSNDDVSLAALARATRVVLSTVGPYARYGERLVACCAEHGTDYCDLAGEVQWMRRMIDRYQQSAATSGARIVHSCGFDSIPSDMGVRYLQQEAHARHGRYCQRIRLLVKAMKGGASGGTFASMLLALEEGRDDRDVRRILAHPYSLNPDGQRDGPDGPDPRGVAYDEDLGVWTAPFVMGTVNTRIVRRSHALAGFPYGRDFRYGEALVTGSGAAGWARAHAITAGLGAFLLAASFDLSREQIVRRLVPAPGEGPDAEERENGYFNLVLAGRLADGTALRARVTGDRDPGYGSTSKMLAEAAACLALDDIAAGGGFWTPATALGAALERRLRAHAGLEFRMEGTAAR